MKKRRSFAALRMTKKEKQDDRSDVQDDRSDAQKFVTLSECEESPLVRSTSRINADPSLTLRMTKKKNRMTDQTLGMTD